MKHRRIPDNIAELTGSGFRDGLPNSGWAKPPRSHRLRRVLVTVSVLGVVWLVGAWFVTGALTAMQ